MTDTPARDGPRPAPWTRILIGCALAFGVALLIGFALAVYGVYWAVSPGRQVPTMGVVGPDSVGAVRLDRASTDPGMQDLVQEVMMAIHRAQLEAQRDTLPPFLEGLRRWQLAQPSGGFGMWLPAEATLSLEPRGDDDEPGYVIAVNFRHFVRPVRTMIERSLAGEPGTRVVVHRDSRILVQRGGSAVGFAGGTLLFADRAARLTAMLDRMAVAGGSPPPPPALRDLSGRWDLIGALDRPEEARTFAAIAAVEDVPLGLTRVRFGLDVETADAARGVADFEFESADAARSAEPVLTASLVERGERAQREWDLDLSHRHRLEGRRVHLEVNLSGLRGAIGRWAISAVREEERDGEGPRRP